MRQRYGLFVLLAMLFFACGRDSANNRSASLGTAPPNQTIQARAEAPGLVVLTPSGARAFTTLANPITLTGRASTGVTEVTWSTGGASGRANGGENWSAVIPLQAGDNLVTLTATSPAGTAVITRLITLNNGLAFTSALRANPDTLFVNEPAEVTFTLSTATSAQLDRNSVRLLQVDANGGSPAEIGRLTAPVNSFDFAGQFRLQGSQLGQLFYRVEAVVAGQTIRSEIVPVLIVPRLSDQTLEALRVHLRQGFDFYQAELARTGSHAQAQRSTILFLQRNPEVARTGQSDGYGVWVEFKNGVLGAVVPVPDDVKSGAGSARQRGRAQAGKIRRVGRLGPNLPKLSREVAGGRIIPDNASALILAPYAQQFNEIGVLQQAKGLLENASPQKYPVTGLVNLGATFAQFRQFDAYGVIYISSHGMTFGDEELARKYGWEYKGKQVAIMTGFFITGQEDDVRAEIAAARMFLIERGPDRGQVGIFPEFIRHAYSGRPMRDSLILCSTCLGSANDSMNNAFFAGGARSVIGYTGVTRVAFANSTMNGFLKTLTQPRPFDGHVLTTGEAFSPESEASYFEGDPNNQFVLNGNNLALAEDLKVTLSPRNRTVKSTDVIAVKAELDPTPPAGTNITYRWEITGTAGGRLDGQSAFNTTVAEVNYAFPTGVTPADGTKDLITVKVFRNGSEVSKDQITFTVEESSGILNGNFSAGFSSWGSVPLITVTQGNTFPQFLISTFDCVGRPGNPYASLDIPHGAAGYIHQTFTVPSGHTKLFYSTWGGLHTVSGLVQIMDETGTTEIQRDTFTPLPTQMAPGCVPGATVEVRSLTVTPGQRIQLRLGGSSTPAATNSGFVRYDDISTGP